jgi:hypothetical protein
MRKPPGLAIGVPLGVTWTTACERSLVVGLVSTTRPRSFRCIAGVGLVPVERANRKTACSPLPTAVTTR